MEFTKDRVVAVPPQTLGGWSQTLWPTIHRPMVAHVQLPEQTPSQTGPLWSLQSFQDKEKSKQTNTNHIQEEVVNKHLSPRVKLKPMPPCSTATSDRHAEGGSPNYTDRAAQWGNPTYLPGSKTAAHNRPGGHLSLWKGSDFLQLSSCIFHCSFLLWLRIPALLKWNHLNPVGPAFVPAEGLTTKNNWWGFVYTHARPGVLSLLHVFPPRVYSGSVTKRVAYYHPAEELSAHVRFGNCKCITGRLNWTWHWAIIRKWFFWGGEIMRTWLVWVNLPKWTGKTRIFIDDIV